MNVRHPDDLLETFDPSTLSIDDDSIEVFEVDTDTISHDSQQQATELLESLSQLYSNYDFLKEHPQFRRRLDSELESLRISIKMRKTSEVIHDRLAQAIGHCPDKAALYMAFTNVQKSLIAIQSKQEQAMDRINNLIRAYQLELEFKEEDKDTDVSDETSDNTDNITARGAKAFISQMSRKDTTQENAPIFEEVEDVVEEYEDEEED